MEIEAKYCVPDAQTRSALLQIADLGEFRLDAEEIIIVHDRYLDTASRTLLAAGYACRLRRQGSRWFGTLKGLGGADGVVHRRAEHELELGAPATPDSWPAGPARDLVAELCVAQPLYAQFDITQTRHNRLVRLGKQAVACLSLDSVCVRRWDALADTDGPELLGECLDEYWEAELELLPGGTEEQLQRFAGALQAEWGLAPQSLSKFERALRLVDGGTSGGNEPATVLPAGAASRGQTRLTAQPGKDDATAEEGPPFAVREAAEPEPREDLDGAGPETLPKRAGIDPDDPMAEAGRKTLRFHLQRMLLHEPGTRRGEDIEQLHDMRVATRRMRAALRAFEQYYDPAAIEQLARGLRRTGRALGAVRDLDVFREQVRAYQAALPEGQRAGVDGFLAELERQRDSAREHLTEYLDGGRYRRFVERAEAFVGSPGMGSLPADTGDGAPRPYRVRHVAPMAVYERLAEVRAYDEWVTAPDVPLARLHALRIAAKRLRYTLEFFQEVLGPAARAAIRDAVAVQDHLGLVQDGVVASGILRDFLVWGTWGPDVEGKPVRGDAAPVIAPGVATYLAERQSEIQTLVAGFPGVWARITGEEFGRSVAAAVGVL